MDFLQVISLSEYISAMFIILFDYGNKYIYLQITTFDKDGKKIKIEIVHTATNN